jgi:hypothetical protein
MLTKIPPGVCIKITNVDTNDAILMVSYQTNGKSDDSILEEFVNNVDFFCIENVEVM